MSDPYYNISIYDGAPIEDIVPPSSGFSYSKVAEITDKADKEGTNHAWSNIAYGHEGLELPENVAVTHRSYTQQEELYFDDPSANHKSEGWQMDVSAPNEHTGPLQGKLKDWVEERIRWHTGSNKIKVLRTWWSILTNGTAVPKHGHTYQTKTKTVSGILWIQGDICPLYVQNKNDDIPDLINNVPGRCVIFPNSCDHWTDPYPHKGTRAGISFDYIILDQEVCACVDDNMCIRCVHLKKNLKKIGIDNVYSGGSQTISYSVKTSLFKNSYFDRLPDDYK